MASGTDPKTPDAQIKDAVPDQPGSGNKALLQAKQLTFSQHLFIWALIILVGVVFGIGSSIPFLSQRSAEVIEGVGADELHAHQNLGARLDQVLNYDLRFGGRSRYTMERDRAAQYLALAKRAEAEGLMPDREERDRLVRQFLDARVFSNVMRQPLPYTNGQLLKEAEGSPQRAVRYDELALWLARDRAVQALFQSRINIPAAATGAGRAVARLGDRDYRLPGETISASAAVLSADRAQVVVAEDDPQIASTYDAVKEQRFRIPPGALLALAVADVAPLAASAAAGIAETAITARYESERDQRWRLPGASATPAYRPLAEVAGEIRADLAREAGRVEARARVNAFAEQVEALGLLKADEAAFVAAAAKAGLRALPGVRIAEPSEGQLEIPGLGSFKDDARLWEQQPGEISLALETDEAAFVARTGQRIPGGLRPLAEVRTEVKAIVAARRGWAETRAAAEAIAAAAASAGPGGLAKILASPEHARWSAVAVSVDLAPDTRLAKPGPEVDAGAEDWVHAAALGMPGHPVLAERLRGGAHDVPRIRLLQLGEWRPVTATTAAMADALAPLYRQWLTEYRQQLVSSDLTVRR
ncbi:MAG: hypothetical protein RLZZ127_1435 [Planctomycetota bacterium]|jgi:hypothetical protein